MHMCKPREKETKCAHTHELYLSGGDWRKEQVPHQWQ